jgi:regulation of enolase protein 1 (concanavalin A-like superfamily)
MEMQWYHEPPIWRREGNTLAASAAPKTDFWRKTHDGGMRDNGHFYYCSVEGDFTAGVKITGDYADQYDQAGLMVRVDETLWLKCGVELVDGRPYASAVVTRDWSDWSTAPLDRPGELWIRVQREGPTFAVHYSLDGQTYSLIRQAFLTETPHVDVGPMLAAPKGDGFSVTFQQLSINAQNSRRE